MALVDLVVLGLSRQVWIDHVPVLPEHVRGCRAFGVAVEGDALPAIRDKLAEIPYIDHIVIGLDNATESQFESAKAFFSDLPQDHSILWNDGPRLKTIDEQLAAGTLAPREIGKGRNVWYCFGYTLACGRADEVALHDCDILTYSRAKLARL